MNDHLNQALLTRTVIGKAVGILMGQEGLTSEAAFERLKTLSQNSNVKLRDVAQDFVDAFEARKG